MTTKNYKIKLISTDFYGMENRRVGDIVFGTILNDGKVLFYSPTCKKQSLKNFDIIFNNIDEAKKYGTCVSTTDFDVKKEWEHMISNRYF